MSNYWLDIILMRKTARELRVFLVGRLSNKKYINPNAEIHRLIRLFFDLHSDLARFEYAMSVNAELMRISSSNSFIVSDLKVSLV